ncbi:MAG TPA: biopolymer transporter ExbD [Gemmatimonadales bacterium]|nr:biopolymer transporter ExbD [Gemmatimonadales bacterium]
MASGIGRGGGLRGHGELPLTADINVTSLVDVAFVLLIIFMITAPIMQGGVEVDLPKAEARPIAAKEGMVVSVNQNGQIYVDETRVSLGDFRMTFGALVRSRKPKSVYLRADRRVPYGNVVQVLAIIRTSGISNVGLVAEEEERP